MTILICGLGNPGSRYEDTRHNVGFKVIDHLADQLKISSFDTKFSSQIAAKKVDDTKVILCKPQTFMNLSGQSVQAIVTFFKIDIENIWIIHDDIDLEFGTVKTKQGGGHGGHNGLRSIDSCIGKNYHRIRVGVGRPEHKDDVSNYVLSNFSKAETSELEFIIRDAADLLPIK